MPQVTGSLPEVRAVLDHDYLIETWVAYKRENEVDPIRLRPHARAPARENLRHERGTGGHRGGP
jgi:hypothetical protein